jgi:hypothetical protein
MAMLLVFTLCKSAWSAQIFTTTIQNTTVQEVQDVSLEYMMEKNFAVDHVEDFAITFTKGFGDGFWVTSRNMIVKFNMIQREDNVKLMVTQFEDSSYFTTPWTQAQFKGQRAIGHLIPLIRDIRHSIDGTPLEQIQNEATNQRPGSGNGNNTANTASKTYATSGLSFSEAQITSVEPGSVAEKAGLQVGDVILEINAKAPQGNVKSQIDKALASGRSAIITYERDGTKDVLSLKPVQTTK